MPCSTTAVFVDPVSQKSRLKCVTWTMVRSGRSAAAWRMPAIRPWGALCSTYTAGMSRPGLRPPSHASARPFSSSGRWSTTTSTPAAAASAGVTSATDAGHSQVRALPRPSGPRSGRTGTR